MGKLVVVVEKTATGYSAYVPDILGIATVAETFEQLGENVKELLNVFIETAVEYGDPLPGILKENYVIEYKFDIQAFLTWMSRVMSQRGLSEIANMNESLISQYASGIKKPGPKQLVRLQNAIHRFSEDLNSITF